MFRGVERFISRSSSGGIHSTHSMASFRSHDPFPSRMINVSGLIWPFLYIRICLARRLSIQFTVKKRSVFLVEFGPRSTFTQEVSEGRQGGAWGREVLNGDKCQVEGQEQTQRSTAGWEALVHHRGKGGLGLCIGADWRTRG